MSHVYCYPRLNFAQINILDKYDTFLSGISFLIDIHKVD